MTFSDFLELGFAQRSSDLGSHSIQDDMPDYRCFSEDSGYASPPSSPNRDSTSLGVLRRPRQEPKVKRVRASGISALKSKSSTFNDRSCASHDKRQRKWIASSPKALKTTKGISGFSPDSSRIFIRPMTSECLRPKEQLVPLRSDSQIFSSKFMRELINKIMLHFTTSFGSDAMNKAWVPVLASSRSAYFSMLCLASTHLDTTRPIPGETATTLILKTEVLHLLGKQLIRETTCDNDVSIITLTHFICSEMIAGNDDAVRYHQSALQSMLALRGGLHVLGVDRRLAEVVSWTSLICPIFQESEPNSIFIEYCSSVVAEMPSRGMMIQELPVVSEFSKTESVDPSRNQYSIMDVLWKSRVLSAAIVSLSPSHRRRDDVMKACKDVLTLPPLAQTDNNPWEPRDWAYEACRLTSLIQARAIRHKTPLSGIPLESNYPMPQGRSLDDSNVLQDLKEALSRSDLSQCWGDMVGVLLWIGLIAGAAARKAKKELRSYFTGLAIRCAFYLEFEYPQVVCATALQVIQLMDKLRESGSEGYNLTHQSTSPPPMKIEETSPSTTDSWSDTSSPSDESLEPTDTLYMWLGPLSRELRRDYITWSQNNNMRAAGHDCNSGQTGIQHDPSGSSDTTSSYSPQLKGSKRLPKRRSDDGDEDERRARKSKLRDLQGEASDTLLACPFVKNNPMKYRQCFGYRLDNISRIKQHLNRKHLAPLHCVRCYQTFPTVDDRDGHLRGESQCNTRPQKLFDGINESQQEQLRKRVSNKNDVRQNWYLIYDILFPGTPVPENPYVDDIFLSAELVALHEYSSERAPSRVTNFVRTQLPRDLRPSEQEIETFTLAAVRNVIDGFVEEWVNNAGRLSHINAPRRSAREHLAEVTMDHPSTSSSIGDSAVFIDSPHSLNRAAGLSNSGSAREMSRISSSTSSSFDMPSEHAPTSDPVEEWLTFPPHTPMGSQLGSEFLWNDANLNHPDFDQFSGELLVPPTNLKRHGG